MSARARGAPRGARGGGRGNRRGRGTRDRTDTPTIAAHIQTVGVRRPDFGSSGSPLSIYVNSFVITIPETLIYHYKVEISPSKMPISEMELPRGLNMDLIRQLQTVVAPQIFTPPGVYDGRQNLFITHELSLGEAGSQKFNVSPATPGMESARGRSPRVYEICLTRVADINPEILRRFIQGSQSHESGVLTAITALNVVIRMEPTMKYPFKGRSFFTNEETKAIGLGHELWRGYFQSVRPGVNKMLVNLDVSTGMMYKSGPLLQLCLEYVKKQDPNSLAPRRGFPDRERLRLQQFIMNIRITTYARSQGTTAGIPRVVKKLTTVGARDLSFTMRDGATMTVAEYFQMSQGRPLKYQDVVCVEVGSGAFIPLELCNVLPGQHIKTEYPPEKRKEIQDFALKKPADRLDSIRKGLTVLDYGQSEYLRQFGMHVNTTQGPLRVQARVIPPPKLQYGPGSKQLIVTPKDGSWNMADKRFIKPESIDRWVIIVYEQQRRFNEQAARDMVHGLIENCRNVGIQVNDTEPLIKWENGQGRIADQLRAAGLEVQARKGRPPDLIVTVLPEGGNEIYTAVKHFGDVLVGVATQCLVSTQCLRAMPQYYTNVCLKINTKLGGINMIPDPSSMSSLMDPHDPTVVMGADVIHPSPGSVGKPSFSALVANVDSGYAKYIADSRVQDSRQEMIGDLQSMAKNLLSMFTLYQERVEQKEAANAVPKRIIFYRDGVSEGQFPQVLADELPLLQKACEELKINPKITLIVVGKRHHIRFFPQNKREADWSGNCPAGTVVDREIVHPTEFDFYLQSHGGKRGTSRPAHYSVLYDDNNFTADALQSLSYALCHVYAKTTQSVSIPAPVYYADRVCSRAKNHYDPQSTVDLSDTVTQLDEAQATTSLQRYQREFKPLHQKQRTRMYFS